MNICDALHWDPVKCHALKQKKEVKEEKKQIRYYFTYRKRPKREETILDS